MRPARLARAVTTVLAVSVLLGWGALPAHASSVLERSPAQLFERAERVLYGTVESVSSTDEGAPLVTLQIERELTARADEDRDPEAQGVTTAQVAFGRLGSGAVIADLPIPDVGDRVLWVLTGDPDAVSPVAGVWQGAWTVTADGLVDLWGRVLGVDGDVVTSGGAERDVETVIAAVAAALAGEDVRFSDEVGTTAERGEGLPDVPEAVDGRPTEPGSDDEVESAPIPFSVTLAVSESSGLRPRFEAAAQLWSDAGAPLVVTFDDEAADRVVVTSATELGADAVVLLLRTPERAGVDLLVRRGAEGRRADVLAQALGRLLGVAPDTAGFRSGLVPVGASIRPNEADARALSRRLTSERGDLDGDGDVDFYDFASLAEAYGQEGVALAADLDGSGRVDDADLDLLRAAYDFQPPSPDPPSPDPPSSER